jgi:hypothetical protein
MIKVYQEDIEEKIKLKEDLMKEFDELPKVEDCTSDIELITLLAQQNSIMSKLIEVQDDMITERDTVLNNLIQYVNESKIIYVKEY